MIAVETPVAAAGPPPLAGRAAQAVLGLDRWFEGTRVGWPTPGYGGPVVHWWCHSLSYRGAGLDWRYEGIVAGYLTLWERTGERAWLARATRAGDDLVAGQTAAGHFRNSRFELNPGEGGTPHEAACAVALLLLARALGPGPEADRYLGAARRNLEGWWFGRLWDADTATLRDDPASPSFVPNKAATFAEAVLLLADLTGDGDLVARYALPTGDHILAMQEPAPEGTDDPLEGAIAQNRFGGQVVRAYFPIYVARCVPFLLDLAARTGETRFHEGAVAAARFLVRVCEPDGGLPQVLYGRGRRNRHPRWVAGAGDVVRALAAVRDLGEPWADPAPTVGWVLRGARPDGRIVAADGFGRVLPWLSRRERAADGLGVAGWCDKAFRALAPLADPAALAAGPAPGAPTATFELPGVLR